MVDQLPNRGLELEMLNEMGFSSIDDLFSDLPERVRMQEALPLPPPQSEEEIIADARCLLGCQFSNGRCGVISWSRNIQKLCAFISFPIETRGEFLTSYTPYQPEVSQGMLQAMWEFQTLISELVGLPIANLSSIRRLNSSSRSAYLRCSCPQQKGISTKHRLYFRADSSR